MILDYTLEFGVCSQGNRYALEKHVDENTKQHLERMCFVVAKQQHQIASLKSTLSRLSLNYSGNTESLIIGTVTTTKIRSLLGKCAVLVGPLHICNVRHPVSV
jgi:hypothetical protein